MRKNLINIDYPELMLYYQDLRSSPRNNRKFGCLAGVRPPNNQIFDLFPSNCVSPDYLSCVLITKYVEQFLHFGHKALLRLERKWGGVTVKAPGIIDLIAALLDRLLIRKIAQ
jgi:hypothetical protein